ncbi:MAG TPA: DUF389 domain-containing protein [Leptospiraceae bacterium]|nr:DUF389 domain-containing protein [Leptospiraceae bacterium]
MPKKNNFPKQTDIEPVAAKPVIRETEFNTIEFLKNLFNLQEDTDEAGSLESIKRSVEFKGGNLWALVFAILIASIGLNVNSTAVIIGAMLISPLMGPIIGTGLAIGIYDFELLKKSLRNLSVATFIGIITSAVYFSITPLSEAQSELLARTNPTVYDVLIASFGGGIGIIAATRKEKSNAIPGVAIATALMPPLCTVGYGIAMGNIKFILGSFYLFFINSFFIGLSTLIVVRFLNFKSVNFVDEALQKKVKTYIIYFSIILILPSIYMAYNVIQKEIFKSKVNRFVSENFIFKNSKVLSVDYSKSEPAFIEVSLVGETLNTSIVKNLELKLKNYELDYVTLKVNQSGTQDVKHVLEMIGSQNKKDEVTNAKDEKIFLLEKELMNFKNKDLLVAKASKEVAILFPEVKSFSFGDLTLASSEEEESGTTRPSLIIKWKRKSSVSQKKKLVAFLQSRLDIDGEVEVIHE